LITLCYLLLQAGKYDLARRQYKKIVKHLSSESNRNEAARSLLLAGHLNLAICYLKLGMDRRARDACDCALQLEPHNIKAFYRRGLVRYKLGPRLCTLVFETLLFGTLLISMKSQKQPVLVALMAYVRIGFHYGCAEMCGIDFLKFRFSFGSVFKRLTLR